MRKLYFALACLFLCTLAPAPHAQTKSVEIGWNIPVEPAGVTVAEFDILEGTKTGGPYTKVGSAAPTANTFTVPNVAPGTYFYVVATLSTGGIESVDSNEASAVVPLSTKFSIGDTFSVETGSSAKLNIRSSPSTTAAVATSLANGTTGLITGGPTASGSTVYWQIKQGWASETYLAKVFTITTTTTAYSACSLVKNATGTWTMLCIQ